MYSQRNEKPIRLFESEYARRRFAGRGTGAVPAGNSLGLARDETLGHEEHATSNGADGLSQSNQRNRSSISRGALPLPYATSAPDRTRAEAA
jgi:hypothetical protein